MAIINILPTPATSSYGVSTDKNVKRLTFVGDKTSAIAQTIEIPVQYGRKKNFSQPIWVDSVPVDSSLRKYNVFSSELVENPYYKSKSLPSTWANSNIINQELIDEQTYYEMKHNKEQGTYSTEMVDLKNPPVTRTKFMNFRIELNSDGVTVLDTSNPDHELIYLMMKQSSKSYNSKFAMSLQDFYSKNNKAEFYVADIEEEKEARLRFERDELETSSIAFEIIKKFSDEQIYKFCVLLDIVSGKTDRKTIEVNLIDFLKQSKLKSQDATKFKKLYKMATEANLIDDFERDYLIKACVNSKVLTYTPDGYFWPSQKNTNRYEIAKTSDRLSKFLKDSKNKEVYEMLKEELDSKK